MGVLSLIFLADHQLFSCHVNPPMVAIGSHIFPAAKALIHLYLQGVVFLPAKARPCAGYGLGWEVFGYARNAASVR